MTGTRMLNPKQKTAPDAPPTSVFIIADATACPLSTISPLETIARADPPLKAMKPTKRMNPPSAAKGTECPASCLETRFPPTRSYFPTLGPRKNAPIRAAIPPVQWTTAEPAKSAKPMMSFSSNLKLNDSQSKTFRRKEGIELEVSQPVPDQAQ